MNKKIYLGVFILILLTLIVGVSSGLVFSEKIDNGLDKNGFPLKHKVFDLKGRIGDFVSEISKNIRDKNE